jgi:ribosomal protein S18 acetylase RimI-like enzyme
VVEIVLVDSAAQLQQVTELSRGFVAGLVELDKSLGVYDPDTFEAYGYEGGQAHLPGDYAAPDGCLLLALADSKPAGCVALRKLDETTCEMRMLFVRPELQGLGIGRALVLRLLEQARSMGYSTMRLDTSPHMVSAHRLYGSLGFREVEQYEDRPDSLRNILVFMERSLV